ncbi:MAG: AAA family ATPase [Pseudomonadota bacterium]
MSRPTKSSRFIVGLTGKNAAGKGEIGLILKRLGYAYFSLSDVLREAAAARGLSPSRETLILLGRELRERGGPGVLAEKTIQKLAQGSYVIDSVRNPAEVGLLRKEGHFFLLAVDAPPLVRFERARTRGRTENAPTLEKFLELEERENSVSPLAQQLNQTIELADETIRNDRGLAELEDSVRGLLLQRKFPCPAIC